MFGNPRLRLITAIAILAILAVAGSAFRASAQDEAVAHPAHIHGGTCDTLGSVIQPLADLTEPTGDHVGTGTAVARNSFTTVAMSLDAMLAAEHALNVHESAENIGNYIACGDIGGVLTESGSLVIGLRELNDSGHTGIAVLTPNAADPSQTDISAFVAEARTADGEATAPADTTDDEATDDATDEATPDDATAEAETGNVDVSLTEFAIEMPDSLPAGETTFVVTNDGEFEHGFEVEGQVIEGNLQPGETKELTVTLEEGSYEIYCPVGNHQEMGMSLELTVTA